ncbi:ALBINO3-like protein 1, chloroplastic isoform X2 [Manihot esculenta]|uniref:ALBINO3-like protein 1, chloroplastic isoform X2 n=1 Tax=Manihot esculenta TaxID=3983 RepID=UPI001CC3E5F9|nr:ALBINO3-like protein 1, chloroplastic isoform X2 [Manihot esculenta]
MSTSLPSSLPNLVFSPFSDRTRTSNLLLSRTQFASLSTHKPFLRGSTCVARFWFKPGLFPELDGAGEGVIKDFFGGAGSILYTIADAVVSNSDIVTTTTEQNNDWLSGITYYMESVLKVLEDGLSALHVPYAYGFAIILLTVLVKAVTFPLTKKQVESAMAMRSLQPQIKAIQQRYAGDQERIQLETARLYKLAGINPFAGCLPTLATIPVWIGLYRALSNVADEGLLTEGFFWIPSLAGPTTIAARQNGSGISWLFPFVTNDPSMKSSQAITKILPLMIGYFALSVPSGLSLYWFTNNILSTVQQVWLQKLGGAKNPVSQEDQLWIQKTVSEINSTKMKTGEVEKLTPEDSTKPKAGQIENLTPEGLRPGERFKQLKEQEAKRRLQREGEKKKAEEAAARRSPIANGSPKDESDRENGATMAGSDAVDEKSANSISNSSTVGVVNGDLSGQNLKKDEKTTSLQSLEKGEVSNSEASGRVEQQSFENKQKEVAEVHGSMTKESKLSEDDMHQATRE